MHAFSLLSLYRATRQGWGPHGQPPSWLPTHYPGCSWPLSRPERHGCHSTSQSSPTAEVTPRAHIARARLGLVTKRCLEVPPVNACQVPAFGRDVLFSGSASPVLRLWLGLTPERPPERLPSRRPRVALSLVSDPHGPGSAQDPRAVRGAVSKNVTI